MKSFGILKPDTFHRNLAGILISKIDSHFHLCDMEMRSELTQFEIQHLYSHHLHKEWWPRLEGTMQEGRCLVFTVEHRAFPQDTVRLFRIAALEIRQDFVINVDNPAKNLIHASENADAYNREALLFGFSP